MYSSRILLVSEESINGWIMMVALSHHVNMLNTYIRRSLITASTLYSRPKEYQYLIAEGSCPYSRLPVQQEAFHVLNISTHG